MEPGQNRKPERLMSAADTGFTPANSSLLKEAQGQVVSPLNSTKPWVRDNTSFIQTPSEDRGNVALLLMKEVLPKY